MHVRDAVGFDPVDPLYSVSVVIPVYRGAKFIKSTLESILGQTVPPGEVIVVDDECPEHSADIARSFGDAVNVITTPNGGASAARNLGAKAAKGRWLAFSDQDDLWHPQKLERQLKVVSQCPEIHYVLTDWTEITDGVPSLRTHLSYTPKDFWSREQLKDGFIVREPVTGKLTSFQPSITSSPIVLRDFFLEKGGFDLEVEWGAEDTCFHFRCLSKVPFGVVPDVLMYYNRHPDAGSADVVKQLRKTVVVWEHILKNYPEAQPYRSELLKGLDAMREELKESERYARRQKVKRILGIA